MTKLTKKVIACILSMLMVITSVPFVALANDEALDAINGAIENYENKMDGTVYTNMADAYTAYYNAVIARDAYVYGNRTDIDLVPLTAELNSKTAAMTEFAASFNTVVPSFHGDDLTAYAGTAYNNLLYSPQVGDASTSGATATASNSNSNVDYELFYAPTVLAYDGVTQLRMPVMVSAKLTYQKDRYIYGCYPIASAENYANHPDLALTGFWYTGKNDTGHADNLQNGSWSFKDQIDANLQTFGYNNETGYGPNQSTEHRSQYLPHSGTLFWWGSQYFYGANIMNINTTFADGEYLKEYQPHWYICASDSTNSANDLTVMRGSNIIYIINYKALTGAINKASYTNVLAEVSEYNKDYDDVYAFLNAYDSATALDVNSFNFADSAKIQACADAIELSCNNLSISFSATDKSDMTDYNRLKNAIDYYKPIYEAGNQGGQYTSEVWSTFITVYESAVAAAADVYENGYTDKFNEKAVTDIAERLDFILDKSGDCGENATYEYNSTTGEVTITGSGALADYVAEGKDSPFTGNSKITSVVIEEGVTEIGDYTLYGCTNLESVVIPSTVTRVGDGAFENCESLSTIIVPAGAAYGDGAFDGCDSLVSVEIASGAIASKDEDDHNAPWYQTTVKSITITDGVTLIGQNAFNGATNIERLTVPCDIPVNTASNTNAFAGMTSLKYITIAKGNTGTMIDWAEYYKRSPWYGNRNNLEMHIILEDGIKNIANYAFYDCANIDDIVIPDTVKSIGERAFYNCSSLDDIYIFDSACTIYDSKFTLHELIKIHGYENSTAQAYATKYDRDFIMMGEHTHNYGAVVTNPSCTSGGFTTYTCTVCGDTYTADFTNPTGHTAGAAVQENYVAPSCTATGSYDEVVYCTVCTAQISRTSKTVAKVAHDYAAVVTQPNCTEGGYTTYNCKNCTASYVDDYTNPLGHNYEKGITVGATCQHDGYTVYNCSRCDASYNGDITPQVDHNYVFIATVPATCTEGGYDWYLCSYCSVTKKENETAPLGHDYVVNGAVSRASFTTEGLKPVKCIRENCNETTNLRIECPTAALTQTSYTYTGKAITPAVVITDSEGNVIPEDQYTVTPQGARIKVGTYKVTVSFNKDCEYYQGTKDLTFKIVPKGTTLSKVTSGTQTLTATWKKQATQTKGYQIQIATDAKFTKNKKLVTVKNVKTLKTTIKKLKYNTKYYVRIRTYSTVAKTDYYSAWSKAKTITVKPVIKNAAVSKLTAGKKQFKATWKKVGGVTGYEVQYSLKSNMSKAKTVKISGAAKTNTTVKKLTSKKKYYVRIRAVKKVGKKTYYGNWSKTKAVTVK